MEGRDRIFWGGASGLTLLFLWYTGGVFYPNVFPGLPATAATLVEVVTEPGPYGNPFYYHVYKTAEMIFVSLAIALVIGTLLGVALGTNDGLESTVSSWIYGWLAVPSLVVVFIAGIWLGFDFWAGLLAVPAVIAPFVVLNMWEGARGLDPELTEMSEFFGADRYQTFTEITLPQLIPFLFASVRSGLSIGWKITLLVETFLLTRGVGFMFKRAFDNYDLTLMTAWLIVFIAFLIVVEYGLIAPLHSRVTHWRPDTEAVQGGAG